MEPRSADECRGIVRLETASHEENTSMYSLFFLSTKKTFLLDCRALLLRKENNHSNVNNNKERGREEALVHRSPATTAKKQHSGRYEYVIILYHKLKISYILKSRRNKKV
jgi:hypothetical protein